MLAAIAAHLVSLAVFVLIFHFLKPFVWFALSSAPYEANAKQLNPDSIEWLVIQVGNFLTWLIAGLAAARWAAAPYDKRAVYVLCIILLAPPLFTSTPETNSILRQAIWWLGSPLGLLIGAGWYESMQKTRLSLMQGPTYKVPNDA